MAFATCTAYVSLSVSLTSGGSDRCSVDTHVQHTTEILVVEVSVTELPQDGQLLVLGVRLREKRLLKGRGGKEEGRSDIHVCYIYKWDHSW